MTLGRLVAAVVALLIVALLVTIFGLSGIAQFPAWIVR